MKKILVYSLIVVCIFSCNNSNEIGKFTVAGKIKNLPDQKIFLEELFFSQRNPEVLDTAVLKNGEFLIGAIAPEEGLYRLRLEKNGTGFIFINDISNITFKADSEKLNFGEQFFNSPATISLTKFIAHSDSLRKIVDVNFDELEALLKQNVKETDSSYILARTNFENQKELMSKYCFRFADTTSNAVLAVFSATAAPVEIEKLELPLQKLSTRFPKSGAVAAAVNTIKQMLASRPQPQPTDNSTAIKVGAMAPEISMTDPDGNPFLLSNLKGKYVLVDFWASWCPPCRAENPNIVRTYNTFKDKNFTILGVSLDENKQAWLNAIAKDKLTWKQISNLKSWGGNTADNYGFDAIPFNVLIDPQGKIIATALHGAALESKLAEVLK